VSWKYYHDASVLFAHLVALAVARRRLTPKWRAGAGGGTCAYPELLEAVHLVVLVLHFDILVRRDVSRRRPVGIAAAALPRHAARLGCSPRRVVCGCSGIRAKPVGVAGRLAVLVVDGVGEVVGKRARNVEVS
jgi:hypothetical protein